ncbi:MAG: extracellular solute-binding protein [Oliverpabstia sp.]|nr:extracellular solute-binding protein [Oliverpabstia sp.]
MWKKYRRILQIMFVMFLVLFTGCQNDQEEIFSESTETPSQPSNEKASEDSIPEVDYDSPNYIGPDKSELQDLEPIENDTLSGELLIKRSFVSNNINFLAQEFMQLHPDVKISFEEALSDGEVQNLSLEEIEMKKESFFSQVRMELASGEADYLIFGMRECLDPVQLSKSGLLIDLQPYFDSDPEIDQEEYFSQILSAYTVDGKLPTIPMSVMYNAVYLNRELLEKNGIDLSDTVTVTPQDLLDWYEVARTSVDDFNLCFTSPGKDALFSTERLAYMDLLQKTARFDSPEFMEFLNRTAAAKNSDPELSTDELGLMDSGLFNEQIRFQETGKLEERYFGPPGSYGYEKYGKIAQKSRPALATLEAGWNCSLPYLEQPIEYAAGPYPLLSSDGKLGLISREDFAIPSSCENPDLAWEFIKYCISPREEDRMDFAHLGSPTPYTSDLPLSKTNLYYNLKDLVENGNTGLIVNYQFEDFDRDSIMDKVNEIFSLPLVNLSAYGVDVQEYLDEFYVNELTTAEQCAEKIQGRAEIWLNE